MVQAEPMAVIVRTIPYDGAKGTVNVPNLFQLQPNATTNLVATPAVGCRFVRWSAIPETVLVGTPSSPSIRVRHEAKVVNAQVFATFDYGIYEISLDANGGVLPGSSAMTVTNKEAYANLPVPTWAGHEFAGWRNGEKRIADGDEVWLTENTTFTAGWTTNAYALAIAKPQGVKRIWYKIGSNGYVNSTAPDGVVVKVPCGSTFRWYVETDDGYAAEAHGSAETAYEGAMPAEDLSFEPLVIQRLYRLTFDGNSGTCIETNDTQDAQLVRPYRYGQGLGALPTARRDGFAFRGWYTAREGGSPVGETDRYVYDWDVTLYARWERVAVYFIAFDGNGATSGTMARQTVERGVSTALQPNAFHRTGYVHEGWTNSSGRVYSDGALVSNLADENQETTLYAKWKPNSYAVAFDSNGQRGTMEPLACTYDVPVRLPASSFVSLTGTFLGWSQDKSAAAPEWEDEAQVVNLATDGQVTLYAIWESRVNDLTMAAHGRNVILETEAGAPFVAWDDSGRSCVKSGVYNNGASVLKVTLKGRGTLSYRYKMRQEEAGQPFCFVYVNGQLNGTMLEGVSLEDGWKRVTRVMTEDATKVEWKCVTTSPDQHLLVDDVVWTPEGDVPEPTEWDRPTISRLERVSSGSWTLSFVSDARFAYRLLGATSLEEPDWRPVGDATPGTGSLMAFPFPALAADGAMARFFKVEVLSRGQ